MGDYTPKVQDPELEYDDREEGAVVEQVALSTNTHINQRALPTKSYLDKTVIPQLTRALTELVKQKPRPADPAEFVAYYLLSNHPKQKEFDKLRQEKNQ